VRPQADIEGCRVAHDLLRSVVADLADAEVRRASKLPGWSVGHVLTHLARNAESMCRRIDAAVRSEVIDQYEGGRAGRAAEIEAGANRDAAALRNDATSWSLTLDDLFESLPDEVWARPVRTLAGDEHPVALLPFMRWWEVEVHLVDLGLTIRSSDWTDNLVNKALPRLLAGLPGRADERELMECPRSRTSPRTATVEVTSNHRERDAPHACLPWRYRFRSGILCAWGRWTT
jgi:maleylpyruvate isomerase